MLTSIILALHLLGFINTQNAAAFLLVSGLLLIASELVFTSGIIAFNGLLALYIAYSLQYGQNEVFGVPVDWGVLFGIAFVELAVIVIAAFLILRSRRKPSTGIESMIGQNAEILEWNGRKGRVRIHGEIWKAEADRDLELQKGEKAVVEAAENLTLKIKV